MSVTQDGHGAAVAFGTSTFTSPIVSITPDAQTREVLDSSHLGSTTWRSKLPADLVEAGGFSCSGFYDTNVQPPITAAAETITVTLPDSVPASGAGATIAASGFVDSWSIGEITSGSLIPYEMHITWATGPTFSDES